MPRHSKLKQESPDSLRKRAEAAWQTRHAEFDASPGKDPVRQLHELQVHQIELELQNDELRRSRNEVEQERDELLELYIFAPVGHLTLDRNMVILRANLKAAALLGVEPDLLAGQNFRRYCAVGQEADSFGLSLDERREGTCELRLRRNSEGVEFTALVETAAPIESDVGLLWRCTITDIDARKLTEQTLAASEEKYRALIETTDTGYHILDTEGRVLDANQVYVRLTGHDELGEILGRSVLEWTASYDRQKKAEALKRCAQEGFVKDQVIHLVDRANRITPVEFNARAIGEGESMHFISLCRDVTERQRAENALRESEERFRSIADTCPAIIWYGDTNRQITFLNKQAGVFGGRDPEELLGDNWIPYVHPDDRASLAATLESAIAHRRRFQAEFRLLRHDGEYRWMLDTAVPRFVGNTYLGHVGIVDDITELRQSQQQVREQLEQLVEERTQQLKDTNARLLEEIAERKQTEEALRESRAKMAAALASMADAVLIIDVQGRIIEINDAAATFCRVRSKEECPKTLAEYSEILDAFLPDGTPVPPELWKLPRALQGETMSNAEYILRRKDTGAKWIGTLSFGPIRGKDGEILGAVFVARDITEQKKIEERQRHAQKLESVGVLAGGIAHDFNNLLTSILGNASIMQTDAGLRQNKRLKAIMESSERAAALTRQLLAYAGKSRFEITDFDLSRLVRSSADLIRVSIPKNIDLQLDLPQTLPLVRGDASQIQQVVMNLVINAAEAIDGDGGKVAVSAQIRDLDANAAAQISSDLGAGRYISLRVQDNGCGMDAATIEKIFDPFFTTKFTGRGLGLAAVHGILRAHQGAIQVESIVGRGSTFTVYLPGSEVTVASQDVVDAKEAGIRVATVLVVDDEEPVRTFMQAALEMFGYRILVAADGRQAEQVLASNPDVELVVLDVVMPILGGAEALREMRKRRPELAFLIVSGYSRAEVEHLGIPAGVPFLEKPYTIQKLAGAVDRALQSHSRSGG